MSRLHFNNMRNFYCQAKPQLQQSPNPNWAELGPAQPQLVSCFCAWKIIGKYIWNLTNPNTIPIITKKTTNTSLFKDPKYKYNDKYANSQNGKHKYDNFWVFGVWNTPKLWCPNIFVPNYAGPCSPSNRWIRWRTINHPVENSRFFCLLVELKISRSPSPD